MKSPVDNEIDFLYEVFCLALNRESKDFRDHKDATFYVDQLCKLTAAYSKDLEVLHAKRRYEHEPIIQKEC